MSHSPTDLFADFMNIDEPKRCELFLARMKDPRSGWFDQPSLQSARFVATSGRQTIYEFTVTPQMCNAHGILHGGCAATIFDDITTSALMTVMKPGFIDIGSITRSLSIVYLKELPLGTKVTLVSDLVQVGKRSIHLRGEMRNAKGEVAAICQHDKIPLHSKPAPKV